MRVPPLPNVPSQRFILFIGNKGPVATTVKYIDVTSMFSIDVSLRIPGPIGDGKSILQEKPRFHSMVRR